MSVTKLQKQIAASTDTIMEFTEKIYRLTLEYGKIPWRTFQLKQNVLLEQCRRLLTKLLGFQTEINNIPEPDYDVSLSKQVLLQNILLINQNIQTLRLFREHSINTQEKLKVSHVLENQIFITNVQQRLQQMLEKPN